MQGHPIPANTQLERVNALASSFYADPPSWATPVRKLKHWISRTPEKIKRRLFTPHEDSNGQANPFIISNEQSSNPFITTPARHSKYEIEWESGDEMNIPFSCKDISPMRQERLSAKSVAQRKLFERKDQKKDSRRMINSAQQVLNTKDNPVNSPLKQSNCNLEHSQLNNSNQFCVRLQNYHLSPGSIRLGSFAHSLSVPTTPSKSKSNVFEKDNDLFNPSSKQRVECNDPLQIKLFIVKAMDKIDRLTRNYEGTSQEAAIFRERKEQVVRNAIQNCPGLTSEQVEEFLDWMKAYCWKRSLRVL